MNKTVPSDIKACSSISGKSYRYLFLVQNRTYWCSCPFPYDNDHDLVLTFDFAVAKEIREQGGVVAYLDHLIAPELMEKYNFETYHFFENWYRDNIGKDIFSYKGFDIGNALRLDIWNDVTYYVRLAVNILAIRNMNYERLYVGLKDKNVFDLIARLEMKHEVWSSVGTVDQTEYFFPIFSWMTERIRSQKGLKNRFKWIMSNLLDIFFLWATRLRLLSNAEKDVYVERYFPTEKIIERLKQDAKVNVILEYYTWGKGITKERRIPVQKPLTSHKKLAEEMINNFLKQRSMSWEIEGFCVSDALYEIITSKIRQALPLSLHIIEVIIKYFAMRNLGTMVYIANLGLLNGLLLDYCRQNKIPSYFILNGLLLHSFPEEDIKGITWINSYGESIKRDYFKGAANVVCLGDPRLDYYIKNYSPREINHFEPTILIGAGGFSNIDLNSYSAVEFEFLHDVMRACVILRDVGRKFKLIVKVRSNGYIDQYKKFLKEYFPSLTLDIYSKIPFNILLQKADCYISIYSGTLFEASCLGIPAIYYKNDTEVLIAPYDGKSELVTALSVDDLVRKMELFYSEGNIFNAFRRKEVLEKYIGHLDGKNTERNMDFIYSLISEESAVTKYSS